MIPLRDVIPSRTTPFLTIILIAINAVVFVYELSLGKNVEDFFVQWALVPAAFSWTAVFTSMFLHQGFVHFGGNMLYLWIFGDNVEDRMGHGRFLAFYVICGVAAALTQTMTTPTSAAAMIGTSGAVAGVMGGYFLLYPQSRILTLVPLFSIQLVEIPAIVFLALWFVIQLLSGVGSIASVAREPGGGIGFWAHLAGFAAGIGTVAILRRPERQRVEWWSER
jgi:membrane associated rhomboid family serine protease